MPHLLNDEPHLLLINPPAPTPEKKEKTQEKQKDHVTDYHPLSPIYVTSYEEDAPNLVDNLKHRPTPKERRDTSKIEENKTAADIRNLIEIRDEEDKIESDWGSECSY